MAFYAALFSIGLAALVGVYFKGKADGSDSRNPEIAAYQASIAASKATAAEALAKAKEVAAKVIVEYRDRVKIVKEREPAEIQLVEVIRSENLPDLSPSFRLLHDSAATGLPADKDTAGTDAAPVSVGDVAETVRKNYAGCLVDKERLAALQKTLREGHGVE